MVADYQDSLVPIGTAQRAFTPLLALKSCFSSGRLRADAPLSDRMTNFKLSIGDSFDILIKLI
jgi:hypothetical protein